MNELFSEDSVWQDKINFFLQAYSHFLLDYNSFYKLLQTAYNLKLINFSINFTCVILIEQNLIN